MEIIDARGYSCPQPVLLTMSAIQRIQRGSIAVLVDTAFSQENIVRAAGTKGWNLDTIEENENGYRMVFSKV